MYEELFKTAQTDLESFARLQRVIEILRAPGGCPWDREQTHESLTRGMVEEAYKQKPLIYTGRNFYNKHLQGKIDDYKIMIAMYTDEEPVVADDREITMWQYTGKGSIAGISGYVDKSRFMGNHNLREIRFRH